MVSAVICAHVIHRCPDTTRAWSSLNATVGGRLRRATPYARSCFSGSVDEGDCAGVIDEYLDPGMFFVSLPCIILRQSQPDVPTTLAHTLTWVSSSFAEISSAFTESTDGMGNMSSDCRGMRFELVKPGSKGWRL